MAIPWHRIFGMALTQYFAGTGWQVDVEVDLSLQQQRLDLVILRRGDPGTEYLRRRDRPVGEPGDRGVPERAEAAGAEPHAQDPAAAADPAHEKLPVDAEDRRGVPRHRRRREKRR